MATTKTTTVVDYPISEFRALIREKIFEGREIQVDFIIQEVGGDPMDRYPGRDEVTRVRVSFSENPK